MSVDGIPVDHISFDFDSRRGRLSDISLVFNGTEDDWSQLLDYYTQLYGASRNTPPTLDFEFWYTKDAAIYLEAPDRGTIIIWYSWDSVEEWEASFQRWRLSQTA